MSWKGLGADRQLVRRKRSGGWEVSERCSYAVGENSIDFFGILYRLFPDTSVGPLGRHGSSDLFVWEQRSVPSEEKSANVRGFMGEDAMQWGQGMVGCRRYIREKVKMQISPLPHHTLG